MAKYRNWINYQKKYPGLSDEIIEVLRKCKASHCS